MDERLENAIRMLLREASSYGSRGLGFGWDFENEEIHEDWVCFENMAIKDIENLVSNLEWERKRNGQYRAED